MRNDNILPEYQSLYNINPDIVGWLSIPNTKIDFPIMQTKEIPEYYLRTDFYGEESNGGTPFADYRCNVLSDRSFNVIIYGHYTDGDGLFRWLLNYSDKLWGIENSVITFDTIYEHGTYRFVAAFYYDATDVVLIEESTEISDEKYEFYNYIELDTKEGFERFADRIDDLKLYDTGETIDKEDELITLVCCAPEPYSGIKENGRFVVIAKRIA